MILLPNPSSLAFQVSLHYTVHKMGKPERYVFLYVRSYTRWMGWNLKEVSVYIVAMAYAPILDPGHFAQLVISYGMLPAHSLRHGLVKEYIRLRTKMSY